MDAQQQQQQHTVYTVLRLTALQVDAADLARTVVVIGAESIRTMHGASAFTAKSQRDDTQCQPPPAFYS